MNSPVTKLKPTWVRCTGLDGPEISTRLAGEPSMLFTNLEKLPFLGGGGSLEVSSEWRLGVAPGPTARPLTAIWPPLTYERRSPAVKLLDWRRWGRAVLATIVLPLLLPLLLLLLAVAMAVSLPSLFRLLLLLLLVSEVRASGGGGRRASRLRGDSSSSGRGPETGPELLLKWTVEEDDDDEEEEEDEEEDEEER